MKRRGDQGSTKKTSVKKDAASRLRARKKGASMGYATGDRVRITEDRGDIKKGTLGTVTQPVPDGGASWVMFDEPEQELLVPDRILEPA